MSHRLEKLNSLIQQELGSIIKEEIELPIDAFVTVSKVDTSVDIKHTNVYISVIPKNKAVGVIKKLNYNVYHLQKALNRKLVMRFVPKIRFVLDHSEEHAARIEEILSTKP
ncbi:MAG: 30S ribosome-binding factor RbfA [Patescibacteria group bacterium]|nr:30S ribosome-binding factor RbfA [Patescibacteria group bacterium]